MLPVSEIVDIAVLSGVVGAVSGAITGVALIWLMQNPIPEVAT